MTQALTALASYLPDVLSMFGSKKSAEDSSALQYYYQSKLNKQNYGYNTKLINMQNAFNEAMMDKANQWNLDRWNESVDLANTAHQREMSDLKSAGLNPILSANGGASVVNPIQSAQASSGNSQLSSSAGMPDIDYIGAISTANGIRNENKRVTNELENSKTQRDYVKKQGVDLLNQMANRDANTAMAQKMNDAKIREIDSNIKRSDALAKAQIQNYAFDNLSKQASANNSAQSTRAMKRENDWNDKNPGMYNFGKATQNIGSAVSFGLGAGATALGFGINKFKNRHKPVGFR